MERRRTPMDEQVSLQILTKWSETLTTQAVFDEQLSKTLASLLPEEAERLHMAAKVVDRVNMMLKQKIAEVEQRGVKEIPQGEKELLVKFHEAGMYGPDVLDYYLLTDIQLGNLKAHIAHYEPREVEGFGGKHDRDYVTSEEIEGSMEIIEDPEKIAAFKTLYGPFTGEVVPSWGTSAYLEKVFDEPLETLVNTQPQTEYDDYEEEENT
jgi:hypothetical protein